LAKILIIFGRATERESSLTRLMGTNSEFVLGPRKSSENVIEVAGRRTLRMHTEFWPAARCSNTRTIRTVPTCAVSLFLERELLTLSLPRMYSYIHTYIHTYSMYVCMNTCTYIEYVWRQVIFSSSEPEQTGRGAYPANLNGY